MSGVCRCSAHQTRLSKSGPQRALPFPSLFSRAFSSVLGETPAAYRQRHTLAARRFDQALWRGCGRGRDRDRDSSGSSSRGRVDEDIHLLAGVDAQVAAFDAVDDLQHAGVDAFG